MAVDGGCQCAGPTFRAPHRLADYQHVNRVGYADGFHPHRSGRHGSWHRGFTIPDDPGAAARHRDRPFDRRARGQQVRAGQPLARLDPTFAAADLAALAAQVSGLEAQVSRLKAEADGTPFVYSGTDANWMLQAAIYGHRKAEFNSKITNYMHRVDELAAMMSRAQSDAAGYRERLAVAQKIEHMRSELQSTNAGSRLNTLLATDARAEMARSLANAQQSAESARLEQQALAAERDGFIRGWQADVGKQLSETSGKATDAREQLNKAKLRRELVELRSEQDAIVQSVAKVSVGSVMQSGQTLITLVPANAPLEVEANISGQENGYVHVRDPVVIKFDTFPYSQYGMCRGYGADCQSNELQATPTNQ